jgi:hypothetical protein
VADQNLSGYGSIAAPVLVDIDTPADGKLEIVQAAENMCVYVIGSNGVLRTHFRPKTTPGTPTKIAATPAVGDFDGDGDVDVVVGTEEVTGSLGNTASRLYAVDAKTGVTLAGWPKEMPSISASGVPTVATGVISSPVLYRPDGSEGEPTRTITGAFLQGDVHPVTSFDGAGGEQETMDTQTGGGGNATDLPFHWGITQTSVGKLGASDSLGIVTGGFGTFLAFDTAAIPGKKTQFQHMVGAWFAEDGSPVPTFPRQIEDWQFLSGAAIADVKGGGERQIIAGSGEGVVHAFDPEAAPTGAENMSSSLSRYVDYEEPAGFPVHTGFGYITSTPAVGQLSRDGKVTVATVTRDGWLFLTETAGDAAANDQWWRFHHDERNTGRYGLDTRPPATVDNLRAEPTAQPDVVRVAWTAVGDDWWVGSAKTAELRWSTSPITDANFDSAAPAPVPPPKASGQAESVNVSVVPGLRPLYFALRLTDDAGNRSLIGRATLAPESQTTAPAPSGGPGPGPGPGSTSVLKSCSGFQLRSVRAKPVRRGRALRLGFTRRGLRPVTLDILRESRGRRIVRTKRVAHFAGRARGVTFRRRLPAGSYVLRGTLRRASGVRESRRAAFSVRRGRFVKRRAFAVRDGCGALSRFKLRRSVFGGTRRTPLSVALRLARAGTVRVQLLRGRRVLRTVLSGSQTTALRRIKVRPRGLRTGDYGLRIRVEIGALRVTRTVYARRL